MPLTKKSAKFGRPDPDTFSVTIGSDTITFPQEMLKRIWEGETSLEFLLGQVAAVWSDAGLNPRTATLAQLKAAAEAGTYYW